MKEKKSKNDSGNKSFSRRKFINLTSATVGGIIIRGKSAEAIADPDIPKIFETQVTDTGKNKSDR